MQQPCAGPSLPLAPQSIGNIIATDGSQVLAGTFNNVYINNGGSVDHAVKICEEALFQTFSSANRDSHGNIVPGTCEWIKEKFECQSWLQQNTRLLWIYGSPGKGKTFLSIFLTKELERQVKESPASEVIYFFCSNQDNRRNNAASILRGLLYQLVAKQRDLAVAMVSYLDTPNKAQEALRSSDILWGIFEQVMQKCKLNRLFCVIDGLDECDEASQRWMSSKISDIDSNQSKIHILVVSRDIYCLRGIKSQIRLDPDNDEQIKADIERFISFKFQEVSTWVRLSVEFQEAVKKQLVDRSETTFLWIGLAINELQSCQTATEIEQRLCSLPSGLLAFYARMLKQIHPDQKDKCAKMLLWVAIAVRPLSWVELAAALGTKRTTLVSLEQVVLDQVTMCRFIVQEIPEGIGVVHQSARDYLLRRGAGEDMFLEDFCVDPAEAHLQIAWTCLDIIAHSNLDDAPIEQQRREGFVLREFLWKQHPLLPYAVEFWIDHAAYSPRVTRRLIQHPSTFMKKKSVLRDGWWRVYRQMKLRGTGTAQLKLPTLHLACYLGVSSWAQVLIEKDRLKLRGYRMINKNDSDGMKPLHHAVRQGHLWTAQLLLDSGADVESEGPSRSTALDYALYNGQYAMARLLINRGADVNASQHLSGNARSTPLHTAALLGHEAIVRLLIDSGASVRQRQLQERTPLYVAVLADHQGVVQILLDYGADINAKADFGCAPLHEAACHGNEGMTRLLLDRGADIDITSDYNSTPIRDAALGDKWNVMQLLLDRGARIDARTQEAVDTSVARRTNSESAQ